MRLLVSITHEEVVQRNPGHRIHIISLHFPLVGCPPPAPFYAEWTPCTIRDVSPFVLLFLLLGDSHRCAHSFRRSTFLRFLLIIGLIISAPRSHLLAQGILRII